MTPDGENDPEVWRELLVDSFGFDEAVYEEVLGTVGAQWRFDDERESQFEAVGAGPRRDRRAAGRARLRGPLRPRVLGRLSPPWPTSSPRGWPRSHAWRRSGRRARGAAPVPPPPRPSAARPAPAAGPARACGRSRSSLGVRDRNRLPAPLDVLVAAAGVLPHRRPGRCSAASSRSSGAGWQHLGASLERTGVSWAAAVVVGLLLGLGLGLSRWFADLTDPLLNALRAVPLFAWLPLVIVQFGLGEPAARVLVFVGALWPVVISTADGVARVPRQHIETARMLGTPAVADVAAGVPAQRAARDRHRAAAVAHPGLDLRHRRRAGRDHVGGRRDDERRPGAGQHGPDRRRDPGLRPGRLHRGPAAAPAATRRWVRWADT